MIQDLLNTSKEEYGEGVQNGKIVKILEYQDGIAFMNRLMIYLTIQKQ